ncbi:MAG: cysteine synthase A [Candidatus Pelagibacter sp.]|nr:cysteine synthase A [Candidatus Pelagibacter sp.]OUV88083.1 MAG: cysteine synthase A [Pelagibacteraceae bacterium TMED136]|tara:strand:+ start:5327 stop:6325 length:999 start_codon:yes stop_codon:yes gene_type:complete
MNKTSVIDLIGNTPLIYLKKPSELSGCNIYGKAEFLNPGQSVKDRAALYIINDALKKNLLETDGTIVEGTAGNTGIGIAMVANYYNINTTIVIPKTQSEEKKSALRNLGANLIEVDAVPYANPKNYVKYSQDVAIKLGKTSDKKVYWANQFDNTINKLSHIETTAPEILRQTKNNVDAFICSVGTGGTLSGTAEGLKNKKKDVVIGLCDPQGSALFNYIKNKELSASGESITEGIGTTRITENFKNAKIDEAFQIHDQYALDIIYDLLKTEGLSLGPSSGINIGGAIELGKKIGPNKNIVTILCDYGSRYSSKIYNKEFLNSKGFRFPDWIS